MSRAALPAWPHIAWSPSGSGRSADGPRILGLNPWIHDFAAYNLWLRPLGLLACLDMLRRSGASVALLDCLDRTWRDVPWPAPGPWGAGRFPRTPLPTPGPLAGVPRRFSRYGLPPEAVRGALQALSPQPDAVLITSLMTYWYPGVLEAVRMVRSVWPGVAAVLGGVYPSLCRDHAAAHGEADAAFSGPLEREGNWRALWGVLGSTPPPLPGEAGLALAADLYPAPDFAPVLGSRGCPFSCAYCGSGLLQGAFRQAGPEGVCRAFREELAKGVRNFAFFDDALLVRPEAWLHFFLEEAADCGEKVFLHAPNALHVRLLTGELCRKLGRAGLATVRLGLETADFEARPDGKLTRSEWERGLAHLREAGFSPENLGAYVLFGLPGQDPAEVRRSIAFAREWGVRPHLAHYSPIPGSPLFERAVQASPYPLAEEPLWQNNSLWPCVPGGFSWEARRIWKERAGLRGSP